MTGLMDFASNRVRQAMEAAFTSQTPLAISLSGDSERLLTEVHTSVAGDSRIVWCEADAAATSGPFDVWSRLAECHPAGDQLAKLLRFGPADSLEEDSPVLPDPYGVYDSIARWVIAAIQDRLVLVITNIDAMSEDALNALAFVVRSIERQPLVMLLTTVRSESLAWRNSLREIEEVVEVLQITQPHDNAPHLRRSGSPAASLEKAITWCRTGALHSGSTALTYILEQGRRAFSAAEVATAWRYLAMAMLRYRRFSLSAHAAREALSLATPKSSACARRILMLALRSEPTAKNITALQQLGAEVRQQLVTNSWLPSEQAWLRLDVALACSVDKSTAEHDGMLDSVLRSQAISHECQAAAHLWRAASYMINGRLDLALSHQRAGVGLLEMLGDFERAMFTTSRLAGTLSTLGDLHNAATHFESAAAHAVCAGRFEFAARNRMEAICARVDAREPEVAKELLIATTRKWQRVWMSPLAQLLRWHAEASVSLACGDMSVTKALVSKLLLRLKSLPSTYEDLIIDLSCEAAYLLGDAANIQGQKAAAVEWYEQGLELAGRAQVEDRVRLLAAGERRMHPKRADVFPASIRSE